MPADRARVSYDHTRQWRGVVVQQGRVSLEADWNEAFTIEAESDRLVALDLVGSLGTPDAGYLVAAVPGNATGQTPGDLVIGAGTLYVGGVRLSLDFPVMYSAQPDWLDCWTDPLFVPPSLPSGATTTTSYEIVYLLAYEQEVSAVEDPSLADVALGGPDTMQRRRIIQHVLRQASPLPVTLENWWSALDDLPDFQGVLLDANAMLLQPTSRLQVSLPNLPTSPDPCQPVPTGGYLGAENQLIRVRLVDAGLPPAVGPTVVWGYDDASFVYRVGSPAYDPGTGALTLTLADTPADSFHYPAAGQAVELLRDSVQLTTTDFIASSIGFISPLLTGYDPTLMTVVLAESPPVDSLPEYLFATSAGPVDVTVTTSVGTSEAGSGADDQYTYGPEVSAVSPPNGPPAGGNTVTLTGQGFTGATQVVFGITPGSNVSVQNDTELTVTVPPAAQGGVVDLIVMTPGGTSPVAVGGNGQYNYGPGITGVTPPTGPLAGGTTVTVTGSGFTGATEVLFGPTPGTGLSVLSDTQFTVTSPASADSGRVILEVTTPVSSSQPSPSATFSYGPTIAGVNPSSGPESGGTTVTIGGTGFTGASEVLFGSVEGTQLSVQSDSQLTVITPAATALGAVSITVQASSGTYESQAPPFTYVPQIRPPVVPFPRFLPRFLENEPRVSGVSPSGGPVSGATTVTVTGSGFTGATQVNFGSQPGTDLVVLSDTELTVLAPPTPAPQQLYLRIWQGLAPTVPGTTPPGEPIALGDTGVAVALTSTGGGFHVGDFWHFALRPIQPAIVYPGRYLAAPQPPEGPRTWACPLAGLTWTNSTDDADGWSAAATSCVPTFLSLVDLYKFVSIPLPAVTDVNPSNGPIAGGTSVTLNGTGFTGVTAVLFGDNPGIGLNVVSDTQLTVTSPPGTGTVDLVVTAQRGPSTPNNADKFAYMAVTGLQPAVGPASGGTEVSMTGSGFTGATSVQFGTSVGTGLDVSNDSQLTVTSPPGNSTVDVTVTTPLGTSPTAPTDLFTYGPTITAVNPNNGPTLGGTPVTVTGTGFTAATQVEFGSSPGTGFTILSDTELTVTSPRGSGTVDVTVTTPGGISPSATSSQFTYEKASKEGKEVAKDGKEKEAKEKDFIHDKVTDKASDKVTDRKFTDKVTDRKVTDAVGARASSSPFDTAEAIAGQGAPAEGTAGRAFITSEERPPVGRDIAGAEDDEDEEE